MDKPFQRIIAYLAYHLLTLCLAILVPLPAVTTITSLPLLGLLIFPLLLLLILPLLLINRERTAPQKPSPLLLALQTLGLLCSIVGHRIFSLLIPPGPLHTMAFLAFGGTAGILLLSNARFFHGSRREASSHDLYPLLDSTDFFRQASFLLSIAGRSGAGLGLIAVDILSDDPFVRKQALFLLLRHSRTHEPWTRSEDKRTCVHALAAPSETAVRRAEHRFREVLESHTYFPFDPSRPPPAFRFRSLFLPGEDDDPGVSGEERLRSAIRRLLDRTNP